MPLIQLHWVYRDGRPRKVLVQGNVTDSFDLERLVSGARLTVNPDDCGTLEAVKEESEHFVVMVKGSARSVVESDAETEPYDRLVALQGKIDKMAVELRNLSQELEMDISSELSNIMMDMNVRDA